MTLFTWVSIYWSIRISTISISLLMQIKCMLAQFDNDKNKYFTWRAMHDYFNENLVIRLLRSTNSHYHLNFNLISFVTDRDLEHHAPAQRLWRAATQTHSSESYPGHGLVCRTSLSSRLVAAPTMARMWVECSVDEMVVDEFQP